MDQNSNSQSDPPYQYFWFSIPTRITVSTPIGFNDAPIFRICLYLKVWLYRNVVHCHAGRWIATICCAPGINKCIMRCKWMDNIHACGQLIPNHRLNAAVIKEERHTEGNAEWTTTELGPWMRGQDKHCNIRRIHPELLNDFRT